MNIGIEYFVRSGVVKNYISFPCCFYIQSETEKRAIFLRKYFGDEKAICVRQWLLSETPKNVPLPPYEENIVDISELSESTSVICPGFMPIPYKIATYKSPRIQPSGAAADATHTREYNKCLDGFYNSQTHKQFRLKWLWNCFISIYFPLSKKKLEGFTLIEQQSTISNISSVGMTTWKVWFEHINKPEFDLLVASPDLFFLKEYMNMGIK